MHRARLIGLALIAIVALLATGCVSKGESAAPAETVFVTVEASPEQATPTTTMSRPTLTPTLLPTPTCGTGQEYDGVKCVDLALQCPPGLNVPEEVRFWVCAQTWSDASELWATPNVGMPGSSVKSITPSGNTVCDDGPSCTTREKDWSIRLPNDPVGCHGYRFDQDGAIDRNCQGGATPATLANATSGGGAQLIEMTYGVTYRFPTGNLCHSHHDFLVCWSPDTRHGFQVSRVVNNTW